jgi:hypothetical protein
MFPLTGARGCFIKYLSFYQSEVEFGSDTLSVGGTARESGSLLFRNSLEMLLIILFSFTSTVLLVFLCSNP